MSPHNLIENYTLYYLEGAFKILSTPFLRGSFFRPSYGVPRHALHFNSVKFWLVSVIDIRV